MRPHEALTDITVCATTAAWCCNGTELNWLTHGQNWAERGARFVLSVQTGLGDDDRLRAIHERVRSLGGSIIEFSIGDDIRRITSGGRLDYITVGRNLAMQRALRHFPEWLMFLDVDLIVPEDSIDRLLEVEYQVVGGDVPSYGFNNPPTLVEYRFPVVERWNTAGFLLVHRDIAEKVRWRYNLRRGMSDDPCFDESVSDLGYPTRVRLDVKGQHPPLAPVESRPDSILRNETQVIVAIPVRDRIDLTRRVMGQLRDMGGFDRLLIYDNGSTDGTSGYVSAIAREDERVELLDVPDIGIYEIWNDALSRASKLDAHLCLLNNDLDLPEGFVANLSKAAEDAPDDVWAVYPDANADENRPTGLTRTHGTKRHGGLTGHAFMIRGQALTELNRIETEYRWWCGDDELVAMIEETGHVAARVDGLPCQHLNEATAQSHAWTHEAKAADLERFRERWAGRLSWT